MVRCKEFYEYFEKKGNFCGKSDGVIRQVEHYIEYVRKNRLREFGGYKISNSALDPFMSIETVKDGKVHMLAIKELKRMIRKGIVFPEKVTRRISIEIINAANSKVGDSYKLDRIPNIRSRIGEFEHEIGEVGFEVKSVFEDFKKDIGTKNNNETMKIILELSIRNIEKIRKIKNELETKASEDESVEMVSTP